MFGKSAKTAEAANGAAGSSTTSGAASQGGIKASVKKSVGQQMNSLVRDVGREVANVITRTIDEEEAREQGLLAARELAPEVVHRQFAIKGLLGGISKLWVAFLLIVAFLPLLVVILATRNTIHFASFLLYIPVLILFIWAKCARAEVMAVKDLLVRFAIGFTIEFTMVANSMLVCVLFGFVIYALFTLNATGTQNETAIFVIYSLILTFAIVIPEEGMKFVQTANFFPSGVMKDPRHYLLVNTFATIGMVTAQSVIQSLAFFAAIGHVTTPITDTHAMLVLVVVVCVSIPMHLISMYHSSMAASRRGLIKEQLNKFCFLIVPVFFRVCAMYTIYFAPLFHEPDSLASQLIMFVCPTAAAILYAFLVKRYERNLPAAYLRKYGCMPFCGIWPVPGEGEWPHREPPQEAPASGDAPPIVVAGGGGVVGKEDPPLPPPVYGGDMPMQEREVQY